MSTEWWWSDSESSSSSSSLDVDVDVEPSLSGSKSCALVVSKRRVSTHDVKVPHVSQHKTRVKKEKSCATTTKNEVRRPDINLPLGNYCCSQSCLRSINYNEAQEFYERYHMDKLPKMDKIRDFLLASLVPEQSLVSSTIAHRHFELKLNGRFLCPTALKSLLHIGMTTLEQLAGEQGDESEIKLRVQKGYESKLNICRDWVTCYVLPNCVADDVEPKTFLRCTEYANETAAMAKYFEYLKDAYEAENPFSTSSRSTFRKTLSDHFDNLLFGESGVCADCFSFSKNIRISIGNVARLKSNKMTTNAADIAKATRELKSWQSDLKEHRLRASQLQSLSKHFGYVSSSDFAFMLNFRSRASSSHSEMMWTVDYMAQKKLPEPGPTQRVSEYKSFQDMYGFGGMSRIHLCLGGLFDSWTNGSQYYLHDCFSENANSVLTILWLHLCKQFERGKNPEQLTLVIDGKSTGTLID